MCIPFRLDFPGVVILLLAFCQIGSHKGKRLVGSWGKFDAERKRKKLLAQHQNVGLKKLQAQNGNCASIVIRLL